MIEITILHLSDIHFKKNKDEDNKAFRKTVQDRLVEAVTAHLKEHKPLDFVVITGDIAFSGKKEEYDEVFTFLSGLKAVLPKETEFLAVPGNHDVDREKINKFFSLYQIIKEEKIDKFLESQDEIKTFINVKFKAYREFIDRLNPGLYQAKEEYSWVKNCKEKNVSFLGLNSAWACEGDEDRFNIALGFPQVVAALDKSKEIANRVLLLHHPFGWLNEKDLNKYSGEIFDKCKLLIHGHVHMDNAASISTPSASYISLGANAVYTHDGFIGFQFIRIRFAENGAIARVWPYKFEERDVITFSPNTSRWKGQKGNVYFDLETQQDSAEDIGASKILPPIPEDYKKWIEEFHSVLPVEQLARKAEAVTISLPEIYIALEVANPFYKPMDEKMMKEMGNEEEGEPSETPPTIDIEELLGKWNCLLLRGNAGTGKTTVIKHLAYSLSQGAGPVPLRGCLPVMVLLKDLWPIYKNALRDGAENITFEALLPGYLKKVRCPLTMETIEAYLAQDRALFLLDGLDEVPEENRDHLVDLLHQFQHAYRANRFLITGRPHGVEGQAGYWFGKYLRDIEPLGEKKAETFINRWFRAVSGQARGLADMTAADMISEIRLHEHAALFIGNPLLLTALCLFYLVGGKRLPDQRADLYDRIVSNLLYRRFHDPNDTDKVDKVQEYLMNLAFTMHAANKKSIELCDARDILKQKEHYPALACESAHEYKKRIEDLFKSIEPGCGLLNPLSSGEIEFVHLSFQEFLAAKHMLDRDKNYKTYLEKSWWKGTLLIYLGLMNLEMKKRSNDIVCEIMDKSLQPRFQLLGAKALRGFQASKRERAAVDLVVNKLITIIESQGSASLEERFEAGEILGQLGDPRIDALNPPMDLVEAGEFTRGSEKYDDEKPVLQIYLDAFMMGKYSVTNQEFKTFINDNGYETKEYWTLDGWQWRREENIIEPVYWHYRKWNSPNFPVVGVSWYEAAAYAQWLSRKTGQDFRLPTEAQWEKAARGCDSHIYPWGDEFDKTKCNSAESRLHRTSPVGIFPLGKSPYGCMDMAGNVWEWCFDWFSRDYYKKSPSKNPPGPSDGSSRVLRGGGWVGDARGCLAASRGRVRPAARGAIVGFRLSRSL